MARIHRTLDGAWSECRRWRCKLPFHLEDITRQEAEALPLTMLLPLLEIADPPTGTLTGDTRYWHSGNDELHRDYDLPAVVWADGSMFWFQHGEPARADGKPVAVWANEKLGQRIQDLVTQKRGTMRYYAMFLPKLKVEYPEQYDAYL